MAYNPFQNQGGQGGYEYGSFSGRGLTDTGDFYTGYKGTVNNPPGGQTGPYVPPFPWEGYMAANEQSQAAIEQGLQALLGGLGVNSPFGQLLMSIMSSPYGLPPELMAQQQRMTTEQFAGSRENALRQSEQSAQAKGFGNSLGAIRAQDMIRAESNAGLNNALWQQKIQDALLAMQRQQGAFGAMGSLYGTDAQLRSAYGQLQGQRQFPIIPTGNDPGTPGFDPFAPGAGNRGYTPGNPQPVWRL